MFRIRLECDCGCGNIYEGPVEYEDVENIRKFVQNRGWIHYMFRDLCSSCLKKDKPIIIWENENPKWECPFCGRTFPMYYSTGYSGNFAHANAQRHVNKCKAEVNRILIHNRIKKEKEILSISRGKLPEGIDGSREAVLKSALESF